MGNIISGACAFIRFTCELSNLVDSYKNFRASDNSNTLNKISLYGQLTVLFTSTAKYGASFWGANNKTLSNICSFESLARFGSSIFQMIESDFLEERSFSALVHKIAVLMSGMGRSMLEAKLYESRHLLDLSAEEFSKIKVPIHKDDGREDSPPRIIGYRPLTREEVEFDLKNEEQFQLYLKVAEAALHATSPDSQKKVNTVFNN